MLRIVAAISWPLRRCRRGHFTFRFSLVRVVLRRRTRNPADLLRPQRTLPAVHRRRLLPAVAGSGAIPRLPLGDGTFTQRRRRGRVSSRLLVQGIAEIVPAVCGERRRARAAVALRLAGARPQQEVDRQTGGDHDQARRRGAPLRRRTSSGGSGPSTARLRRSRPSPG